MPITAPSSILMTFHERASCLAGVDNPWIDSQGKLERPGGLILELIPMASLWLIWLVDLSQVIYVVRLAGNVYHNVHE